MSTWSSSAGWSHCFNAPLHTPRRRRINCRFHLDMTRLLPTETTTRFIDIISSPSLNLITRPQHGNRWYQDSNPTWTFDHLADWVWRRNFHLKMATYDTKVNKKVLHTPSYDSTIREWLNLCCSFDLSTSHLRFWSTRFWRPLVSQKKFWLPSVSNFLLKLSADMVKSVVVWAVSRELHM